MARHIVIVGGAASGLLLAARVTREAATPTRITVVEPRGRLGEGVAYGTVDPAHLLNVPAGGMQSDDDEPSDFARWAGCGDDDFVERMRYAEYLRDTMARRLEANPLVVFEHLHTRARRVGLRPLELSTADARRFSADAVVLALGNAAPTRPAWTSGLAAPTLIDDPWRPDALEPITAGANVLCVGTGLTFVDVALSLARRGARVTGVSRHGLLPAVHAPCGPPPPPPTEFGSPADVSRWIRSQSDWRAAFAALRPATQDIWRGFTDRQQSQFLRHARRYWDTHRHRMAPVVAEQLETHRRDGLVTVTRGDGRELARTGEFDHVVLCTGPDDSALLASEPLASLVADGTVRAGPHGIGIATDPDTARVVDATGRPVEGLFTIGPLRRGTLWESTAVPEIRAEARRLATLLLA